MDESWIYQYDPETKTMSMEWKHVDSPLPKKGKGAKFSRESHTLFFGTVMESFSQITFQRDKPSLAHTTAICWTICELLWKINSTVCSPEAFVLYSSWQCTSSLVSSCSWRNKGIWLWGLAASALFPDLATSDLFLFQEIKNPFRGG